MHGEISEDIKTEECLDCGQFLREDENTLCFECLHKDDKFYEEVTLSPMNQDYGTKFIEKDIV